MTDENTRLPSDSVVEALREIPPRAYLYQYTDPMSGKPVWRSKGEPWNGQTPKQTEALYSVEQIAALAAQPRDDVRQHPCWSETLGRNAHRSYVHDGDMRCERCDTPLDKDKSERIDAALSQTDEQPDTQGTEGLAEYEARVVHGGMPTDCCDYGVVSLSRGKEVCRVWEEEDARTIADLLNALRTDRKAVLEEAAKDFRSRARICRTNDIAFDLTAASVWDAAADALETKHAR